MIHKETVDVFVEGVRNDKYPLDYKNPLFGTILGDIDALVMGPVVYSISKMITSNSSDLFIYPNIPDSVKNDIRRNFKLFLDEEILYVRDSSFWNERNQGLVITDCKIILIIDNSNLLSLSHILISLPSIITLLSLIYAKYIYIIFYFSTFYFK